ncbi:hypothetical protein G6L99_30560 [Agrobacterium rhizogenes]|uniref:hypothetical protein n=1 Tax=Rhizobium rhizogenes TaxID=359 RepID=UPI00157446C3|nr:hypothetical protein [Rhizobium rhizogenes]NTH16461.1 hypothetical protein [Rhizobium rhizogenes]NTI78417.1 hypothetical protein [Rhizobium rhizogenes]
MSFPKKGKSFPADSGHNEISIDDLTFAMVISLALRRAIDDTHLNIKTVVKWTGANERTVKNWFSGRYGPSGDHLMVLANHCDEVMDAIIRMTGRKNLLVGIRLEDVERRLSAALALIREVERSGSRSQG